MASSLINPWLAWRQGDDPRYVARTAALAHERFIAGDARPARSRSARLDVRSVVLDSWRRSRAGGVDPDGVLPPMAWDADQLAKARAESPLAAIMPVVRRLLVDDAADAGLLVAVADAHGRLLWVEGETDLRDRAADMHFLEGARWGELDAGTNAPALAIRHDHAVQVFASEHFHHVVQTWSCSAAPVHHPITGAVIGAIDITGGDHVAAPQILGLVNATVAAAEAQLRARPAPGAPVRRARPASTAARLRVLGTARPTLQRGAVSTPLTLRHAEILLLLAASPDGMSADDLALRLAERDLDAVTVRVEMSRLRAVLGAAALASRPYRLTGPLDVDATRLRRFVESGHTALALRGYIGPVLPASQAPGVVALRDEMHWLLRSAALASGDADVLLAWCAAAHGSDDIEAWEAAIDALAPDSPRRACAQSSLAAAHRRLR